MTNINGKTLAAPYVFNVNQIDSGTGLDPQYKIIPLLTMGDEVPALEGEFGKFKASDQRTFAMSGIPDGLGWTKINGLYYVWMNHEFAQDKTSEISSTLAGKINGSRVSLFVFDEKWNVIGGKNLIETAVADGKKYKLNLSTGNYELVIDEEKCLTDPDQILNMDSHQNFTRFCSGYLAASGFVNNKGEDTPIYFVAEESTGTDTSPAHSRGWAISVDGVALALDGLGIYAKEQVYSPTQYRANNSDYTVLISTEDYKDGELYMYVGKQTADNPNGFTNKPEDFDLYVLQVVDPTTKKVFGFETMAENQELTAQWTKVPDEIALGTQNELSDWVNAEENGVLRSTNFRRLEDIAQDPNNPNDFYLAVTGTTDIPAGSTKPDNDLGKMYRINIAIDPKSGTPVDGKLELLLTGGAKTGVSYDNIEVDSNGNVLIQEDTTARGEDIIIAQKRNGRVISYNIAENENKVGNDEVNFLFEIDQKAAGEEFDPKEYGDWESSGIVEADPKALGNRSSYLFDVQAGSVESEKYGPGGQLLLTVPVPSVTLKGFASLAADTFAPGPSSGNFITTDNRPHPFASQPVQGFSGVQFAPDGSGAYWVLSDNGFGTKDNSADYLLRIYQVNPSFAGAEGGNKSVKVDSFIQLSDPHRLLPNNIVNEDTSDRLLTGADLDPESMVIGSDGDIWIGDEFGPYLLHFDSTGKLIEAPIATLNILKLNTLYNEPPLVIGHRGASGELPEHTIEAYKRAIEQGADFVEPDLVSTKEGVLIARHEPNMINTTDVSKHPEFADRLKTKMVDGVEEEGYFAEDFTLAEIKTLRAVQPRADRDQSFNGKFEIPTLAEVIDLVKEVETETGKKIGIYPETKHPTYFAEKGLSLEEPLVKTLLDQKFTDPDRIFIQSFEVQNLLKLKNQLLPGTALENTPLVQLYDEFHLQPYDIVSNFSKPNFNPKAVYGTDGIKADTSYGDLINQDDNTNANLLKDFVASYATGVGPWKRTFVLTKPVQPVDGNGDGKAEITEQLTGKVLPVVEDAHDAGLKVHPYTFRNEERHLVLDESGKPQTPEQEFEQYIRLGVDGYFTDYPKTGARVRDQVTSDWVKSPQNPDVLAGKAVDNLASSKGFEGMAFSVDRQTLYPLLEGSVTGDAEDALRIYKFDVKSSSFQGLVGYYQLEANNHAIGDFTPINANEFLVIERDPNQGKDAQFKKIYKVDFSQVNEQGFVAKEELVDLLHIQDPQDLNGDGKSSFDFPFTTIEDVLVVDRNTILVANDNNYPFSIGRGADIDNNEMILLQLEKPLALDARLGGNGERKSFFGTNGADEFKAGSNFDGVNDLVFGNGGNDLIDATTNANSKNNVLNGGEGNDQLFASQKDNLFGDEGADTLDASKGLDNNSLFGDFGDDQLIAGKTDKLSGGAGSDTLDATVGKGGNRIYGDQGDDLFLLGSSDLLVGGNGADKFYVGTSGGNKISGGEGADQFWIANAKLPSGLNPQGGLPNSLNKITDFDKGIDLIGIDKNLGITAANVSIIPDGSDALISVKGQKVVKLLDVAANSLVLTDNSNALLIA